MQTIMQLSVGLFSKSHENSVFGNDQGL